MSVLVIGNCYWGHADDLKTAKKNFRAQGGRLSDGYVTADFGEHLTFAGVDEIGRYFWDGDGRPDIIEHPPRKH